MILSAPARVGILLILFAAALWASVTVRDVFVIMFLGVVMGALLTLPIDLCSRVMPRTAAVLLVLLLVIALIVGIGWLAGPFIAQQAEQLAQKLPRALEMLTRRWSTSVEQAMPESSAAIGAAGQPKMTGVNLGAIVGKLVPAAFTSVSVIGGAAYVLALAFFFADQPERYRIALRALVPTDAEPTFDQLWQRIGATMLNWIRGIFISMTIVGVVTAVGLRIAGIDGWAILGVLAFFGTFVPYLGALAAAIPGLAVGLAASPRRFVYALIVYAVVHVVEGYITQPMVMRRAVSMRPAVLLFGQLLFSGLFGIVGFAIATPLVACLSTAIDTLYVERVLKKTPIA